MPTPLKASSSRKSSSPTARPGIPTSLARDRFLKPLFERGHGRRREAHPSDERVDVPICVRDHRSSHVRTLALETCEERLDESPTNTLVARLRVNAEELHPAGRLLETELATTDLAQHESDHAPADLSDLR